VSIRITCKCCQATYKVKDKYAGKQGFCPFCAAVVSIPALDASSDSGEWQVPPPVEPGGETVVQKIPQSQSSTLSLRTHVEVVVCTKCKKPNLVGGQKCMHCAAELPQPRPPETPKVPPG